MFLLLPRHKTPKNVKQCLREQSKLFRTKSNSEDTAAQPNKFLTCKKECIK